MKKLTIMIIVSVLLLSIIFCGSGCSNENNTEDLDTLLQTKDDGSKGLFDEQQIIEDNPGENDVFVSVWPDEFPVAEMNGHVFNDGRPIAFYYEISPGQWTADFKYESMYLYDFPDPVPYFNQFGRSFLLEKKIIIFKYNKLSRTDDGIDETVAITKEDFDLFIDNLIAADYTDNSERTETTYYCEKYGVGITIALADVFPFADDDEKLRAFPTGVDCCYVKLQLIDPDYVMDLEQIKAEEYQKWLEKQKGQK
ncbi:MAG: hypothetical protein IJL30_01660 [Clostridia bacterium]|nr:hypothetical protein [Clostridia bacterium]